MHDIVCGYQNILSMDKISVIGIYQGKHRLSIMLLLSFAKFFVHTARYIARYFFGDMPYLFLKAVEK